MCDDRGCSRRSIHTAIMQHPGIDLDQADVVLVVLIERAPLRLLVPARLTRFGSMHALLELLRFALMWCVR